MTRAQWVRVFREAIPAAWSVFKREWQLTTKDTPFFVRRPIIFTMDWWRQSKAQIHKRTMLLWWVLLWGSVPVIFLTDDPSFWGSLWVVGLFFANYVRYWHLPRFCHRCGNDFNAKRPRKIYYSFPYNHRLHVVGSFCEGCATPQDGEVIKRRKDVQDKNDRFVGIG